VDGLVTATRLREPALGLGFGLGLPRSDSCQPTCYSDQRYHSLSATGRYHRHCHYDDVGDDLYDDDSWSSSTSDDDDDPRMTSSGHVTCGGVTSSSSASAAPPPHQLCVSDLFSHQPRPQPPLTNQRRPVVNMAADYVTSRYWRQPELETEDIQRQQQLSLDDSAIDNQSASSAGSRAHHDGSRINQSAPSARSTASRCHDDASGHDHVTQSIAVIACSAGDVGQMRHYEALARGKRPPGRCAALMLSSAETDGTTVYSI